MISCLASARTFGNCLLNHQAPNTEASPPSATVHCAVMRSDKAPLSRAPSGAIPMNIMEYTDITLPRSRSGTILWISVFEDPISIIIENPTGTRIAAESQKVRDSENG